MTRRVSPVMRMSLGRVNSLSALTFSCFMEQSLPVIRVLPSRSLGIPTGSAGSLAPER